MKTLEEYINLKLKSCYAAVVVTILAIIVSTYSLFTYNPYNYSGDVIFVSLIVAAVSIIYGTITYFYFSNVSIDDDVEVLA